MSPPPLDNPRLLNWAATANDVVAPPSSHRATRFFTGSTIGSLHHCPPFCHSPFEAEPPPPSLIRAPNMATTMTHNDLYCMRVCLPLKELGITGTGYPTRWVGYMDDILPASDTQTQLKLRRVRGMYFFPPTGDPSGIRI
jgi:hypothetical protein